jgi:protein-S-isoprenylcysteine O-methyltransferase Ste14
MPIIQIALFLLFSSLLTAFSWPYLRTRGVHGFYRYLAWECLLALILFNSVYWLKDPFSGRQILSWILLVISTFLAIHAFILLKRLGRPEGSFENTTRLVETGAYRLIRHPLYASLLALGWGVFFKRPAWPFDFAAISALLLALALGLFLYLTARVEEAENLVRFGPAYRDYMSHTHMFIPYIW